MPHYICDSPLRNRGSSFILRFKLEKTGKDITMKWYRELYLGKGIRDRDGFIRKIETNAGQPGVYLVTLAANNRDLFDVFSADLLFQPVLHGHCPLIVGAARGKDAAVEIATGIALDAYRKNGDFDVRRYLKERVSDGGAMVYEYPMEKLKKRKRFRSGK